jgi:hypothetical protein
MSLVCQPSIINHTIQIRRINNVINVTEYGLSTDRRQIRVISKHL